MNYDPLPQIPIIERVFPQSITCDNNILRRSIIHAPYNTSQECEKFVKVMESSIASHYITHKGPNWQSEKLVEMQEDGLIYVCYRSCSGATVAFVSFVLTEEEGLVVYLYEIQVIPKFHGRGLGKTLITCVHQLSKEYIECLEIQDLDIKALEGTKLTVFSDNLVLNWYKKLGYQLAEESPRDRKLRSGKIIKPECYIMFKKA